MGSCRDCIDSDNALVRLPDLLPLLVSAPEREEERELTKPVLPLIPIYMVPTSGVFRLLDHPNAVVLFRNARICLEMLAYKWMSLNQLGCCDCLALSSIFFFPTRIKNLKEINSRIGCFSSSFMV